MTVLKIGRIIELGEVAGSVHPLEAVLDDDAAERMKNAIREIARLVEPESDKAKKIIVDKIGEARYVEFSRIIQDHAMTALVSNGHGMSLLRSHMSGELKAYTDTFVFCLLGILISDEVI